MACVGVQTRGPQGARPILGGHRKRWEVREDGKSALLYVQNGRISLAELPEPSGAVFFGWCSHILDLEICMGGPKKRSPTAEAPP